MGQTFACKILGRKAGRRVVPGEIVEVEPDAAMSHDNTAAIAKTFAELGVKRLAQADRHVIVLDHCAPAANEKFARNHQEIRRFVRDHSIPHFYDVGRGVCHQVMVEQGHVAPGALIVGSDSHSTTYGALGAFSTGIGRSEMAVIMATGRIWLRVPESVKINISGSPPRGLSAKDIMLKIIGDLGADGALYQSVCFSGPVVAGFSISSRMVLANMAVEMGAKNGYVEPDARTRAFLDNRIRSPLEPVLSDPDAPWAAVHEFDVSDLEPQIACPHAVDNVVPVSKAAGVEIDQVFFGSCTNARLEDFEIVASVLRGSRVHPNVRMIVAPASSEVYAQALRKGYIQDISDAGALIINSGCGPCMGNHRGVPAPGEVVLSTSNRNFRGRFGCAEAEIYLASPLIAAISAVHGRITGLGK